MLRYVRFRGAGGWLAERHEEGQAMLFRRAPLPPELRRASEAAIESSGDPDLLGRALGGLLRVPPTPDLSHLRAPRVALSDRLGVLRRLLGTGRFAFERAVEGSDRMTVAVTLYALLELYKTGEAHWEQAEPFGPITVTAGAAPPPAALPIEPGRLRAAS
jgi:segregation and condensation protein A